MVFSPEEIEKITALIKLLNTTKLDEGVDQGRKEGGKTLNKDFEKKFPEFKGNEEEYGDWSFKVKMAIQSVSAKLGEVIEETEMMDDEVNLDTLRLQFVEEDKYYVERWPIELYEILGLKVEGVPLTILRNIRKYNGFEAWRMIRKESNSSSPAMCLKSLVGVVCPGRARNEKKNRKNHRRMRNQSGKGGQGVQREVGR